MTPLDGLSFQLYSARTLEPPEAQFELLAGLGYKQVEPYGGLLNDPQALKHQLELHGLSAPSAHVGLDRLRADQWLRPGCAGSWVFGPSTSRHHRLASAMAARPSGARSGGSWTELERSSPPRA
jgi:hypothetical protein